MDVSPTLRMSDHLKTDLFDLVSCTDYDLTGVGLGTDWTGLDELVGRNINNNNVTLSDVINDPTWGFNFQDPPTPFGSGLLDKDKETSDKMWGGGGAMDKMFSGGGGGNSIIISFPSADVRTVPDTSDPSMNPSPLLTELNGLDLFHSLLNEKTDDVLSSHNHRSPGSDCVSYVSAASGYSDSGISTSIDDTASPHGVDFDRMVDSAVDSLAYSPGGGSTTTLIAVEDAALLDSPSYLSTSTAPFNYQQNSDVSSILESALRGTVKRSGTGAGSVLSGIASSSSSNSSKESKTLTVMTNMTPLPPLSTAFKSTVLGNLAHSAQITSTNAIYMSPPRYEYHHPTTVEEFTNLDVSFNKLSTTSSSSSSSSSSPNKGESSRSKKRKYTKRSPGEEPTAKGRLLHFCHICNKGFKDKYSVNVHIRTHTGEKPFNCELCGKCFRQKAHLAKHVQIHNAPKPPGKR